MPTTNFQYNDANVVYGGYWVTATHLSTACFDATSARALVAFGATGTSLTVNLISGVTQPVDVIVDGVSSTPTITINTVTSFTVSLGAEGLHTVVIRDRGTNNCLLIQSNTFAVTGASPALSVCSGYSTTNATIDSQTSKLLLHGGWGVQVTTGGTPTPYLPGHKNNGNSFSDAVFGCYARCTDIIAWGFIPDSSQKFSLTVDGGAEGADFAPTPVAPNTVGNWGFYSFGSGLDGTAAHEYRITTREMGDNNYLYSLMFPGGDGNGAVAHSWPDPTNIWAFYGDSITQGIESAMGTGGSRWNFPWLVSQARGVQCLNAGIAGADTFGASEPAGKIRYADVTAYGSALKHIFILYGTNDLGHSISEANFTAAYTAMLNSMDTALQSSIGATWYNTCKIWCLAILLRNDSFDTSRAAYNTDIQTAIAATTNPTRFTFVDSSAWLVSSDISASAPHPKPATSATSPFGSVGAGKIATNILSLVPGDATFMPWIFSDQLGNE